MIKHKPFEIQKLSIKGELNNSSLEIVELFERVCDQFLASSSKRLYIYKERCTPLLLKALYKKILRLEIFLDNKINVEGLPLVSIEVSLEQDVKIKLNLKLGKALSQTQLLSVVELKKFSSLLGVDVNYSSIQKCIVMTSRIEEENFVINKVNHQPVIRTN